jgi:hypothetical protein
VDRGGSPEHDLDARRALNQRAGSTQADHSVVMRFLAMSLLEKRARFEPWEREAVGGAREEDGAEGEGLELNDRGLRERVPDESPRRRFDHPELAPVG